MQDLWRELCDKPSRLAGWGVVALVHVLMWLVLSKGLDVSSFVPALKVMHVEMYEQIPPPPAPPPPPQAPKVDSAAVVDMYVPAPEVQVMRETASPITATSIMPTADNTEAVVAVVDTAAQSNSIPVVSDSEVDYVVRPQISYPVAAKRAREQGIVLLSVVVDEQGQVRRIKVHRSSGYPRLDEVALRALRALRVKPYKRNGTPLAVEIRVPVEFSLSSAA